MDIHILTFPGAFGPRLRDGNCVCKVLNLHPHVFLHNDGERLCMRRARKAERSGVAGEGLQPTVERGVGREGGDCSDGFAQVQPRVLRCTEAGCRTTALGMTNNDN